MFGPAAMRLRFTESLGADLAVALAVFLLIFLVLRLATSADVPMPSPDVATVSSNPWDLPYYAARSLLRMFIALIFSYAFALIFGYWAARSRKAEKLLVPTLDILQSVPVLGFLGITVVWFVALFPGSELGLECASIFAIFTAQAWNLAFSMYNSSLTLPAEFDEMSHLFRLSSWLRFWRIEVPNASIGLVWNGMMSMGGAWFFLTASETITYDSNTYSLPGVGAFAGQAIADGDLGNVWWSIGAMIVVVVGVNVLFWRPMVAWAERFRNEQSAPESTPKSFVLNTIRAASWPKLVGRMRRIAADKVARPARILGSDARPIDPPPTRGQRARDAVFWVIVIVVLAFGMWHLLRYVTETNGFSGFLTPFGLGILTMLRVAVVLVLSTVIWVPIGIKIGLNPKLSRIAQPLVQIFASFPSNLLFPFFTAFLVTTGLSINWGSIILMLIGAQWYVLFNVIAGAQSIPGDLREAMADMRVGGWLWWKSFGLPAVLPAYVTGGITASGGAWNASIVAEVVTFGSTTLTAAGLGAYIAEASSNGNEQQLLMGIIVMSVFVVALNRLVWKRLYRLAERRYSL